MSVTPGKLATLQRGKAAALRIPTTGAGTDRVRSTTSPRTALQRHLGNQGVRAIQAKLRVGRPDDRFEREADEMAEQVVRRQAVGTMATDDDHLIRRQVDDEEDLIDEELEEVVQARAAPGGLRRAPEEEIDLVGELRRSRSGGEPLPESVRVDMEGSFQTDFSSVRLHRDPAAGSMARSLNALAFTHGEHVYFGAGNFSPGTESGRRLLGHELAHVVQQNPGVRRSGGRGAPPDVQTAPAGTDRVVEAAISLLDDGGEVLWTEQLVTTGEFTGLDDVPSGIYSVTIVKPRKEIGSYSLSFDALDRRTLELAVLATGEKRRKLGEHLDQAASAILLVDNPFLPVAVTTGEGKAKGGDGTGTERKAASKYGYLAWINFLDQKTIDELDKAAEQMDGFDEFVALRELLLHLKESDQFLKEFETWLQPPEALLEVLLGLRGDSTRIDAIAAWAQKKTKTALKLKNKKAKGILKIARSVKKLLMELKRVVSSILTVRQKFVEVFETIGGVLAAIQGLEELLDFARDVAGGNKERFERLLDDFAGGVSREIHTTLDTVRQRVQLAAVDVESFELVTPDAMAQALTTTFIALIPRRFRWVTRIIPARLQGEIAEKLVKPLVSDSLLDPINKPVQNLLGESLAPFVAKAGEEIGKVIDAVEPPLVEEIVPSLRDLVLKGVDVVVRRDAGSGAGEDVEGRLPYAARLMGESSGVGLPEGVRQDMEHSFGRSFADVRVHSDASAHLASRLLRANAFTLGRDVYFDRGRYAPESSAGRRLLAHELTHVVQQGVGSAVGTVQRDASDTVKALGKKLAAAAFKALSRQLEISEAEIQEARDIRKFVRERLVGRPPSRIEGTKALKAYTLSVKKRKKKEIVVIRRKIKWRRFVDALEIKGGNIQIKKAASAKPGSFDDPFEIIWPKPPSAQYEPLYFGGVVTGPKLQSNLRRLLGKEDATGTKVEEYRPHDSPKELAPGKTPGGKVVAGVRLGLSERYRVSKGTKVGPLSRDTTPKGDLLNDLLGYYGYSASDERRDGDHVHDIQLGGRDVIQNLWPLDKDINSKAGIAIDKMIVKYPGSNREVRISRLKRNLSQKYYFKVKGFR